MSSQEIELKNVNVYKKKGNEQESGCRKNGEKSEDVTQFKYIFCNVYFDSPKLQENVPTLQMSPFSCFLYGNKEQFRIYLTHYKSC